MQKGNRKMRNKTVTILLALTLVLSLLAGCGAKTEATDQVSENSDVVENETENINEETNASVGAENEDIVLYAEIEEHGKYIPFTDTVFEPESNTIVAYEDIPIYNEMGVEVGYVKNGSMVELTESATEIYWARFENPIAGTDYDYLYVLKDYIFDENEICLDEAGMKQGIEDFIVRSAVVDVDVTPVFLDGKTPDMEMYECRMDSTYSDELDYDYWLSEQFIRKDEFRTYHYETFYVECEEDTDGWIICRIYYKDLIDFGY